MCTAIRFIDEHGGFYFGRNLDWNCSYGEQVIITPTGFQAKSPFKAIDGIKYPVIGMGIIQENMPLYFDCANEAGLAIAGLNFPGYTHYAKLPQEDKTNVAAYEFPLWVAASFESVDQVEEALRDTAIIDWPINEHYPSSLLHWFIGDATRSIVVECAEEGLRVFHDDFDVLANQPNFVWHTENIKNYLNVNPENPGKVSWGNATLSAFGSGGNMRGLPGDYYSPSRFVRAAYLNAHYPQKTTEAENISRLFHTLGGVAMAEGAACMTDGSFEKTIYTGGFSSSANTYYYSTYDNPAIRSVHLAKYHTLGSDLMVASDSF